VPWIEERGTVRHGHEHRGTAHRVLVDLDEIVVPFLLARVQNAIDLVLDGKDRAH
jgi:hypothetical protein